MIQKKKIGGRGGTRNRGPLLAKQGESKLSRYFGCAYSFATCLGCSKCSKQLGMSRRCNRLPNPIADSADWVSASLPRAYAHIAKETRLLTLARTPDEGLGQTHGWP